MIPTYPESCISHVHAGRLQGLQEHVDLLLLGIGTAVLTAAARAQRRQRLRGQHLQQQCHTSLHPELLTKQALSALTAEEIPKEQ